MDKAEALIDVRRFLDEMLKATTEKYAAMGEGEDVRLVGSEMAGGGTRGQGACATPCGVSSKNCVDGYNFKDTFWAALGSSSVPSTIHRALPDPDAQ